VRVQSKKLMTFQVCQKMKIPEFDFLHTWNVMGKAYGSIFQLKEKTFSGFLKLSLATRNNYKNPSIQLKLTQQVEGYQILGNLQCKSLMQITHWP